MFDFNLFLPFISDWLIPYLRNERILARRPHQISVQIDSVFVLLEKNTHCRTEDGLGGRLHVVARLGGPGLGTALGARDVRLTDDVALMDDEERAAVARRDGVGVVVPDRLPEPGRIHTQVPGVAGAPPTLALGGRIVGLLPGGPCRQPGGEAEQAQAGRAGPHSRQPQQVSATDSVGGIVFHERRSLRVACALSSPSTD